MREAESGEGEARSVVGMSFWVCISLALIVVAEARKK